MGLATTINDQIKQAMLAKDKVKLSALRDVKSKILLEATSGSGTEVSDEVAIKICMKLHKQRMETYEIYLTQGRPELAEEELLQAQVIEAFLPKQLSVEEIDQEIAAAIEAVGATGPQDMGKVMGMLSGKLAGKADGKIISARVKEALNS
jgi:uncharacterized protein YqeY